MYNVVINKKLYPITHPLIMGIVNITDDSFYRCCGADADAALQLVEQHINHGAHIIDIGACSTRPDTQYVSADVEWGRLEKILGAIRGAFPDVVLSVDTFRSNIAKRAVTDYGVDMINDISGGQLDEDMFSTAAQLGVPYILTHYYLRPKPELSGDMLMADVIDYFQERIYRLHHCGVRDIIIDPGFGFGKTIEQNYQLLSRLSELRQLNSPILVGVSHKSMLYRLLNTSPDDTDAATTAAETIALMYGADIIRTHNVKSAYQNIRISDEVTKYKVTKKQSTK